jgi:malate dehydrogenase (oxaloacetate-decarboxylating)(NADP+)
MVKITTEEALFYHHLAGQPGKICVMPTKPLRNQRDLSLAYTPGVAAPVLEIDRNPDCVYEYTAKGNLVAVISNGSAILGLGNRGPLASKPVMEGKAVLFKKFADIDVFDLEIDCKTIEEMITMIKALEPTFGGINLEDICSPDCFRVEQALQSMMDIPVFHDDQHGTAIILAAGLLNSLELVGKKLDQVKIVFSGAGAAAIACANQLRRLGAPCSNIWLTDIAGLVYEGRREEMFAEKMAYAKGDRPATLAEVLKDADVFIGLSAPDLVTPDMLLTMARDPIVFALANPDPEIKFELAKATRPDAIVATGRSDYPNQINNVLGFPFIFRGALDVRARKINEQMKLAASHALAGLARQPVPAEVCQAYNVDHLEFGRDYILPKPLDRRVVLWEAPAVARAAMETQVARLAMDIERYRGDLSARFAIEI